MNDPGNITVNLKGPQGKATLSDFSVVCSTLRACLRNVARCLTGHEEVEYDVSDLQTSSAYVAISPLANGVPMEDMLEVGQVFSDTIYALEAGNPLDPRLDFRAISAFNGFSGVAKRDTSRLLIGSTILTRHYAQRIADLLQADSSSLGSVTGRLESVSIHNESKFTLYPPIAGEEVDCIFPRYDLENVLRAVAHNVTVYGTLYFSKTKSFPIRVEVESYEIMPEADSLPTLLDTRGSLRFATTVDNMLREIRDEWK